MVVLPIVGTVGTASPCLSRNSIVVLPAASRPSISRRTSPFRLKRLDILETKDPILCFYLNLVIIAASRLTLYVK